ncbi:hypothetical protein DICPUDRAFT_80304 [Dictyostelium purpureum]|uniref:Uncharacterized protein n=1 Tax=Dictyostelium purpureum TaxID=5786 RepID=F0ZQ38_DICPU|nr:uncharacterized protein DICPUDRAFT_80304 [Dictyostelium purpureum]EGC33953.1 hypothetical protein DICPUDRAFT_80304 [Dictyostelium purpureum]|eukprot:XP_003289535.1 hypothetical protein DICPUDRAFT_80304 [Dictyostelium purpureum]
MLDILDNNTNNKMVNKIENNTCNIGNNTNNNNIEEIEKHVKRTWEDLKNIIKEGRLEILGRKNKDQLDMERHMSKVKSEFNSAKDYIDFKVFQFPTELKAFENEETGLVYQRRVSVRPNNIEQRLVIRPNDFPYHCDADISHWVLWCLKPLTFEEAKEFISKIFKREYANDNDGFIFFVNPEHLQSIKDIFHYHVFIRNIDYDIMEYMD